jgi:hypothetical protein
MLTPNPAVRVVSRVPTLADFGNKVGTPIVINRNTGIAYYLDKDTIRPIQGGPVDVQGAFSDGFSPGYA